MAFLTLLNSTVPVQPLDMLVASHETEFKADYGALKEKVVTI